MGCAATKQDKVNIWNKTARKLKKNSNLTIFIHHE